MEQDTIGNDAQLLSIASYKIKEVTMHRWLASYVPQGVVTIDILDHGTSYQKY